MLDAVTRKPYQSPILTTSTALRERCRITTSNGAVLPPLTVRDRTTTIPLDTPFTGHHGLTDKVFETPGWSKVVMVEPTGMKTVKLIGACARPSHTGKGERRIHSRHAYE